VTVLSTPSKASDPASAGSLLPWVDTAKGICILLVVLMHTVLGIEKEFGQSGYLREVVAWTKPFRIPDFFMLSGFLAAGIGKLGWREFIDRKILHYAYFYLLWLAIIIVLKSLPAGSGAPAQIIAGLTSGLVEPFSTLWFIYVLPLFILGARLARGWAIFPIIFAALILHFAASAYPAGGSFAMVSQLTSSTAINSFTLFFIFFLAGYFGRQLIEKLVQLTDRSLIVSSVILAGWAGAHSAALHAGITVIPGFTLIFGIAGGLAVAVLAVLIVRAGWLGWLAYCGRHSLAIYLTFVIPMAVTREIFAATGLLKQPDLVAAVTFAAAILLPLLLERVTAGQTIQFLFKRPLWARLPYPGRTQ